MRFVKAGMMVWVFLAALTNPSHVSGQVAEPDDVDRKSRHYKAVEELARELNNEIHYYGKVVDLDGMPVAGAVVKMTVRVAGAVPPAKEFNRFEMITDEKGEFAVETFGDVIGVDSIVREGYRYHYRYNPVRDLKSQKKEQQSGPGFEPDKPFSFRVRKLGPPAFVVIHNMTFGKKVGTPSMFDLIKRQWVHREADIIAMQYSSVDRDWHTDVRLWVEGEPGRMRLVLETPDPDSGFVVERHEFGEVMIEAPAHGYRNRLEIPVKSGESPLNAYVKCQGGLFYARLHVEFHEQAPGGVWINATSFTNLAGGRGLEYTPSVESQYDDEVYGERTRKRVRRADLLSGQPVEMPVPKKKRAE